MKVMDLFLITLFSGCLQGMAQRQPQATAGVDVGAGLSNNGWSPSILYHEEISPREFRILKAGFGLRTWGYYGGPIDSRSAEGVNVSPDVLKYGRISVNGLSVVGGLNARFWKMELGANTDLMGLAVGSRRKGLYVGKTGAPGIGAEYYNKEVVTSPKAFNLIPLFQRHHTGSSELYLRVWLSDVVGVKVGYLAGRISYLTKKVEQKRIVLDAGQSAFSTHYGLPYVSICFAINE
jgi:hypothetical protein